MHNDFDMLDGECLSVCNLIECLENLSDQDAIVEFEVVCAFKKQSSQ